MIVETVSLAAGHILDDVPLTVAAILARHAPAAGRMNSFYWNLFGGYLHEAYPQAKSTERRTPSRPSHPDVSFSGPQVPGSA